LFAMRVGGHERLEREAMVGVPDAAIAHRIAIIAKSERPWQAQCDKSGGRRR
jgi:hypothetical protein